LKSHYSLEELLDPQFFLSTNARMALVEDQIDVYLGYLYDTSLKHRVIQELIVTIWNTDAAASANLDPYAVADHITQNTRQFGINSDSCYFGRSQNMKVADAQMDDNGQDNQRRFLYTATTLRLMEQIAMGIGQQEASLLVGETGTGKTTSVQELAKILGKKLHVFNMNQNTDSSDLLGGFKPVDLKFLLKPLYELFLSVFKAEFKNLEKNKKFLDLTQKCYEENKVREFLQCLNHGISAVRGKKNFQITKDV
jgi:midasin